MGKGIIKIILSIISIIGTLFALNYMWLWFMTPLGLPMLPVANLLGIDLFITFLTIKIGNADISATLTEEQEDVKNFATAASPWVFLFVAWIVQLFM